MVLGRVLVLLAVHALHVDHVRVHVGQAAAQEHGRNQENGKQTLPNSGTAIRRPSFKYF